MENKKFVGTCGRVPIFECEFCRKRFAEGEEHFCEKMDTKKEIKRGIKEMI